MWMTLGLVIIIASWTLISLNVGEFIFRLIFGEYLGPIYFDNLVRFSIRAIKIFFFSAVVVYLVWFGIHMVHGSEHHLSSFDNMIPYFYWTFGILLVGATLADMGNAKIQREELAQIKLDEEAHHARVVQYQKDLAAGKVS